MNKLFFKLGLIFLIMEIGFVSCTKEEVSDDALLTNEVKQPLYYELNFDSYLNL